MKGADVYANIFDKEQHGRLYLYPSSHGRGQTFQIWLLPEGVVLKNDDVPWVIPDAVEIYGIVAGNSGWTEEYGWLYQGKWIEDFNALVEQRKQQIEKKSEVREKEKQVKILAEEQRIERLLSTYK
uniref:Uncharacterized protein n=1 Tax=viral metagenome TaxID=1070528 RepID=A0A6M3KBH2_9ZZZZ